MDIRVRATEATDADAIAAISSCPGVIRGTLQFPYRAVEEWRRRLATPQPGRYSMVAEVDGRVVGVIGLNTYDRPRRRHVADIGMYVHDDFQGKGVGSALMDAMLELGERWIGLKRIELTVFVDNVAAIRLYKKYGFVVEGTAQRYALRDGEYADAYYMARVTD